MMNGMANIMRREAMRAMSQTATVRIGIVSAYDPSNYSAKVRIQPEDAETGWMPITTPWSGSGWGMLCPPSPGDVVDVHFQEGGKLAGFVALRHYGDQFRPLNVPAGEFWIVHKSGSFLKFLNDGTIEMNAATAISSVAPVWNHTGDFTVNGEIRATGDIIDRYENGGYTMASFRATYDAHTHYDSLHGTTSAPIAPNLL